MANEELALRLQAKAKAINSKAIMGAIGMSEESPSFNADILTLECNEQKTLSMYAHMELVGTLIAAYTKLLEDKKFRKHIEKEFGNWETFANQNLQKSHYALFQLAKELERVREESEE
jgi:xylose isomerase